MPAKYLMKWLANEQCVWCVKSGCGSCMEICFQCWWEREGEECARGIGGSEVSWGWDKGEEVFWRRGDWVGGYWWCVHSVLDSNYSGNSRVAVIQQWEIS